MNRTNRAAMRLGDLLAVALAGLAVYTAGFGVFDNVWYSGLTVALGVTVFLIRNARERNLLLWVQIGLAGLFVGLSWVWLGIMLEQEEFFIDISRTQLALAWLAIALIGYATWRGFGAPMLIVYLALGAYILAPFGANESWTRVAENLFYSTDGVYGRPVEVVGRIVLVFIAFGAVLQASGAGAVILKIAFAATARFTGGPAHAAIVGSGLFGTLSGSPIANVVSTGVFTIPIIKRTGFSPKFAGAVEAAASTGGQIMPPIMGVVAFLMADVTGIPYLQIVLAATIPALFFYAALFMVVLIEARRLGIRPQARQDREDPTAREWLQSIAFFAPLGVIVWLLIEGRTAQYAGFYALITAFLACLVLFPQFRHPRKWLEAAIDAGVTAATLMVIVAAIGFVIGVINMSGVGLKFAQAILQVSGSSLFLSLILVMLGCIVMGMGVPSAPAYLIVAIVMGPALEQLGVPTIGAHLFMLYFAVLSVVTPPVALAAFAAAPIAGAKPMETGIEAVRLSIAGFIIPFLFVFHPDILIIDGFSWAGLGWGVGAFGMATWLIVTGLARFERHRIGTVEAAIRLFAAGLVLVPLPALSASGGVIGIAILAQHRITNGKRQTSTKGETA